MNDDTRPVIKLQIDMEYDARSHIVWAWAPEDWNDMTAEERQQFLDEEAQQYLDQQVSAYGTAYATLDEANNADHGWGGHGPGDAEDIEERF